VKVTWSGAALRDLGAITSYLEQRNPAAAVRLATSLLHAADSLETLPDRGAPGRVAGTRELLAHRPYVVVYAADAAGVRILRIWHAPQDRG
jgi:toxin ParE1/3/4